VAGGPAVAGEVGADAGGVEMTLACPGLVYRRDAIDRLHTGTPHQLDLWRLSGKASLGRGDLLDLVGVVVEAALPGARWRTVPAEHPYTTGGLEIQAYAGGRWVEIGECGLAAPHVLAGAGLPAAVSGLALGLGLDRLVMLRKGIDDIRLLRSPDPRVTVQMADLAPYRPVSAHPAARRDVSVAVPAGLTAEDLGDRVRDCLGADARLVEEVAILSTTEAHALPPAARDRLAIRDDEVNVLLRVVLRDLDATITTATANGIRDRIYAALHHDGPATSSDRTGAALPGPHDGAAAISDRTGAALPGYSLLGGELPRADPGRSGAGRQRVHPRGAGALPARDGA
jgi:phenylalanyl-tRNA synthetase alpha chain